MNGFYNKLGAGAKALNNKYPEVNYAPSLTFACGPPDCSEAVGFPGTRIFV